VTPAYRDCRFTASDGLTLAYRDYGDPLDAAVPVLCLTGIQRNSKDFHALAQRLAPRRVLCPDYRGRGRSAYDPAWVSYRPDVYLADILHLLTVAGMHRAVVIGTSMGGLLAMGLAVVRPTCLAAVVLNDVGPDVNPAGLTRIAASLGRTVELADRAAAAKYLQANYSHAYPDLPDEQWLAHADRVFRRLDDGRHVLDYDANLGKAVAAGGPTRALWPLFRALADVPVLAIRGMLSDVLSEATFERMRREKPDLLTARVANRGHVPLLDEPDCAGALDGFLARHRASC
jgi:pimeloyl-ACP methyl ester carboxylesterase